MNEWIDWFQRVLDVSIRLYFRQECDLSSVYDIPLPKQDALEGVVAGTGRSYFRRVDGVDVGLNASSFSADVGYFFCA